MPFVNRDSRGNIVAVSQEQTVDFVEELSPRDPLVQSFLQGVSENQTVMTQSDLDLVRVVEDLVEVLISKNYILFTDLPDKAQEKIRARQTLRGKISTHLDLLDDEDAEGGFF